MARARRTYTDDQKAAALALYATDGPTAVQDQQGIPKATVTAWAKTAGIGTVRNEQVAAAVEAASLDWELRRVNLAHRIGETAEHALHRCEQALEMPGARELRIIDHDAKGQPYDRIPTPSDAKALATTMAILVDKAQLLTGAATSRHETAVSDERVADLRDELAERRAKQAA